jgi:hypothetical protein
MLPAATSASWASFIGEKFEITDQTLFRPETDSLKLDKCNSNIILISNVLNELSKKLNEKICRTTKGLVSLNLNSPSPSPAI